MLRIPRWRDAGLPKRVSTKLMYHSKGCSDVQCMDRLERHLSRQIKTIETAC